MLPKPHETELQGFWLDLGSSIAHDSNWERINRLTGEYLECVATAPNGRDKLYRDPGDGRFWELTSVAPEMKEGGPPLLAVIGRRVAEEKYRLDLGRYA